MNKLFLVSGASGSGKSTTMRLAMNNEIVSVTTREMRDGEVDGKDYYYITLEQFTELDKSDMLAEKTVYKGSSKCYGVTKEEISEKLEIDDAYIIVDFNGMQQLKALYPEAVSIYLYTDKQSCFNHMLTRGDKLEDINKRLAYYDEEVQQAQHYDYKIKNITGQFSKTINIIKTIVSAETNK